MKNTTSSTVVLPARTADATPLFGRSDVATMVIPGPVYRLDLSCH